MGKNVAASVRARLINIATESKRDYNAILRLYFQERFLYRVSVSGYKQKLILKGALLLMMKDISKFRPTKDIDFLGREFLNEMDECKNIIKEIASIQCNDGVEFIFDKIKTEKIKEEEDYEGVRIHLPYKMDTIKGYLSIDIGFGDKVVKGPFEMDFPAMLDFPAPQIFVYSMESAVAEKFEAIVKLNILSSRMKDFYDIHFFAASKGFDLLTLHNAIVETFNNRQTSIEKRHSIFNDKFRYDENLKILWKAFIDKRMLKTKLSFTEVVTKI